MRWSLQYAGRHIIISISLLSSLSSPQLHLLRQSSAVYWKMGRAQPRVSLIIKLWFEDKIFESFVMFHKVIIMFLMTWPPPQWWLIHEILWVNYGLARDKLLQLILYQNTDISLIYLNTKRCDAQRNLVTEPRLGHSDTVSEYKGVPFIRCTWIFLTFQPASMLFQYTHWEKELHYKGHWWRFITINQKNAPAGLCAVGSLILEWLIFSLYLPWDSK